MPDVISRATAIERGEKYYFTGDPCPHGHVAKRFTKNCVCIVCNRRRRAMTEAPRYATGKPCKNGHISERFVANGVCVECNLAAVRASHGKHKDRRNKEVAEWRRANPKYTTAWARENKDRVKVYDHTRRARKAAAGGAFTRDDIARLLKAQKRRCACCAVRLTSYEVDHIVPIARGGSNAPANLQILCMPCNRSKGARPMEEFMRQRGALL